METNKPLATLAAIGATALGLIMAAAFSEQQTVHLIFAKLLFVRGELRG